MDTSYILMNDCEKLLEDFAFIIYLRMWASQMYSYRVITVLLKAFV